MALTERQRAQRVLGAQFEVGNTYDRFMAKVDAQPWPGCWTWEAAKYSNGYGAFSWGHSRARLAHRTSWELFMGPIPEGLCVLHRCDNPPCVRPDHLFLGSQADNLTDMTRKGRRKGEAPKGEHHGMAKLNRVQVDEIRSRYAFGNGQKLADEYGVTNGQIHHILKGRAWR